MAQFQKCNPKCVPTDTKCMLCKNGFDPNKKLSQKEIDDLFKLIRNLKK